MYFDSFHDLLTMNGHGTYVWLAYSIGFAVIIAMILVPLLRHRSQIRTLQNQWRDERYINEKSPIEKK